MVLNIGNKKNINMVVYIDHSMSQIYPQNKKSKTKILCGSDESIPRGSFKRI